MFDDLFDRGNNRGRVKERETKGAEKDISLSLSLQIAEISRGRSGQSRDSDIPSWAPGPWVLYLSFTILQDSLTGCLFGSKTAEPGTAGSQEQQCKV